MMLKQGIGLGLLCIAGHAFSANITVTTTDDVVKADDQCSLREAIEYVNQGMPEAGYNGCGGASAASVILLESGKEYKLNSQVVISKSVDFKANYETNVAEINPVLGKRNATIKANGKDRIFKIDRSLASDYNPEKNTSKIEVNFSEITLNGCGQSVCSDQGGLIYNTEAISFQHSQLLNGFARQGGAIYNVGVYDKNKALSSVTIKNTLIKDNQANEGAAVYSELPLFLVSQSLVRDNTVLNDGAALFDIRDAFNEEALKALGTTVSRGILNSTIFNNKGYVSKVYDGMQVNNITMVFNTKGLLVNIPLSQGYIANSILAKNGTADCTIISGGKDSNISNNLYSAGCGSSTSTALGDVQLIAGSSTEGVCDVNSSGILCPFAEKDSVLFGYFLPRILPSYKQLSESLIVNRGPFANNESLACSSVDQRGKARIINETVLCDRGAIELVIDTSNINSVGQDILFGQTAKLNIANELQDGELVPASQCNEIFNRNVDENGKPWQAGCLKVMQTNTPSKGSIVLSQNGEIIYTPNNNWQGSDEFKINVVTSITRFNKSDNPYIAIPARIVQRKPDDFKDDKVKVSGGGLGILSLVGLIGLAGYRRKKFK